MCKNQCEGFRFSYWHNILASLKFRRVPQVIFHPSTTLKSICFHVTNKCLFTTYKWLFWGVISHQQLLHCFHFILLSVKWHDLHESYFYGYCLTPQTANITQNIHTCLIPEYPSHWSTYSWQRSVSHQKTRLRKQIVFLWYCRCFSLNLKTAVCLSWNSSTHCEIFLLS